MVIDPLGNVIEKAADNNLKSQIVSAQLDLERITESEGKLPFLKHRVPSEYQLLTRELIKK